MGQDSQQRKAGLGMIIIAWVILGGLLVAFFYDVLEQQANPNRDPHSNITADGAVVVALQANKQHHYVMDGSINGHAATFLLDTGATHVSVPSKLAKRMGMRTGPSHRVSTANGSTQVYASNIHSLKLGAIELTDVSANINPSMDAEFVLLGMSALKKIEFKQINGQLILKQQQ